jgi:hypothetical protein
MAAKDPDENILAVFKELAVKDEAKSAASGRPIYTDEEIVELHYPGSKNWSSHPATSFSNWTMDPLTGEQVKVTYAERFSRQYRQFKAHAQQTKSGTPTSYATFLTEARRAELRAQNIYTVEALASIDGQELKNLGPGGREMKNAAMEYIEQTQKGAVNTQMQAELEALRAQSAALADELAALKVAPIDNKQAISFEPADEFDGMDIKQLREYITSNTGQAPIGALNTRTLRRMARDCRPEKASAA